MHGPRDQAIDLVELQHHGAEHHVVVELCLGGQLVHLAGAPLHHGGHVTVADAVGVDDLEPRGQFDATVAGHLLDLLALAEQHAAGDTAALADRGGFHGAWLVALWQHDAPIGVLGQLDQLVAERRG